MRRRGSPWLAGVVMLLAVACGAGSPAPSPSASPSGSSPIPANPVADALLVGHVHLEMTGDLTQTYEWDFVTASNEQDMSILSWGGGLNFFDLLAGRGALVEGTHRSSRGLWVSLVLDSIGRSFVSDNGECTITLSKVNETSLKGRVACDALTSDKGRKTVHVVGTFSAGPRGS